MHKSLPRRTSSSPVTFQKKRMKRKTGRRSLNVSERRKKKPTVHRHTHTHTHTLIVALLAPSSSTSSKDLILHTSYEAHPLSFLYPDPRIGISNIYKYIFFPPSAPSKLTSFNQEFHPLASFITPKNLSYTDSLSHTHTPRL